MKTFSWQMVIAGTLATQPLDIPFPVRIMEELEDLEPKSLLQHQEQGRTGIRNWLQSVSSQLLSVTELL